jgi:hypothetical protein
VEQTLSNDGTKLQGDPHRKPLEDRSTLELVRSIVTDTSTLVRKEVELARQEIVEGVTSKLKGAGAMVAAAVLGLFVVGFLGLAAAYGLDLLVAPWLSRLIVAGAFLLVAALAGALGMRAMKKRSLAPEETKRTVKEDVEWARAQLKR